MVKSEPETVSYVSGILSSIRLCLFLVQSGINNVKPSILRLSFPYLPYAPINRAFIQ